MGNIKDLVNAGLDLLFPASCSSCQEMICNSDAFLCTDCFSQLKFIETPYCNCCGSKFPGSGESHLCGDCLKSFWMFDKARSFFAYEEIIAGLIHTLKYSGSMNGLETLRWLSDQSTVMQDLGNPDFILPVPLHVKRLRKRGFNQALVLARSLFPKEKKKIRHDILVRKVDTSSQAGLGGVERRRNLKNAFDVTASVDIAGRTILLLDDVFTTGTTVQECAKVLKLAGAGRIEVLTICRADKLF